MSKKRVNGEGSIRRKPNGRWEGRYTQGFDPVTGKAIQKSVSAKTQAECKEKLRRGELMALLWEDLNVENCILCVSKQVVRVNGDLEATEPKTQNSIRKVALPQQTVDLLIQKHQKRPDNPLMFPSLCTGTYWSLDDVSRINKNLLKRTGIDTSVHFLDLRHTFSTIALQSRIDVKTVSNMLGHYSTGFTLDPYTHVTDQMQKAAAQRMQGVMDAALPDEQPDLPQDNSCKVIEFKRAVNSYLFAESLRI